MTPTNRLRYVERKEEHTAELYEDRVVRAYKVRRVLQQWWNDTGPNGGPDIGEWRDVPLEAE